MKKAKTVTAFLLVYFITCLNSQAQYWELTGNSGTTPAVNFIGTTDNNALVFKVNKLTWGKLDNRKANVFFGRNAGNNPGIGNHNIAIGDNALRHYRKSFNVAIGDSALYACIDDGKNSPSFNTGIGYVALRNTTTGSSNTACGSASLFKNTIGYFNSGFGASALNDNISGNENTAVGTAALYKCRTGSFNTALGSGALGAIYMSDVGDGNTVLGSYADVSNELIFNSIAIGFNTLVDQPNKVRVGDDNILSIGGMVGWTAFSDSRFKKNVQANVSGLDFILKLKPVTYNVDMHKLNDFYHFNDKFKNEKNKSIINRINEKGSAVQEKILYSGFLAQEVEKAAKEAGYNFSGVDKPIDENHSVYGLRYGEFVVPIVKAIQELDSIIKSKEKDKKIEELTKKLDDLAEQMKNIEAVLSKCCPNVSKKGILLKNGL